MFYHIYFLDTVGSVRNFLRIMKLTQSVFTCSQLTIETLEQGVKYFQS